PLLRERDMSRIACAVGDSAPPAVPAGRPVAQPRPVRGPWTRLTRRSSATSLGNVLGTRYRPRNNREILPKPAHGTHALQEYEAAGAEPASTLDPRRPHCPLEA